MSFVTSQPAMRAFAARNPRSAGTAQGTNVRSMTRSGSVPLPLSVSQTWLWCLSRLAPDSSACNEVITIRKTGPLDVEALRRAFTDVVARHEAWRTTFRTVAGVPHQFVWEPAAVDLPFTDLSDLDPEDAVRRATEIAAAEMLRPYDLADGPLIRPRLIRISADDHRLYLGVHHLVFDETTLHRVVFPELMALYRSYAMGVPSFVARPGGAVRRLHHVGAGLGPRTGGGRPNSQLAQAACRQHPRPAAARSPATAASDVRRRDHPADDRAQPPLKGCAARLGPRAAPFSTRWPPHTPGGCICTPTRPRSSSASRMTCATATTCRRWPAIASPRWSCDAT